MFSIRKPRVPFTADDVMAANTTTPQKLKLMYLADR